MEITKTLRKPSNWQDFEKLCWMLWREEWQCQDLIKNGRNGQNQHGVDLSGQKNGETEYSGIQCKCKLGNASLSAEEIDIEIKNAIDFKPALKRLVFATTADKDVKIEEYVREKDIENRKNGLFSISIKSWNDIVDLMDIHLSVRRNYENSVAIYTQYAAKLTFANESECLICTPRYNKLTYYSAKQITPPMVVRNALINSTNSLLSQISALSALRDKFQIPQIPQIPVAKWSVVHKKTNHSYCQIQFKLHNTGNCPLDECKIRIHFKCDDIELVKTNIENCGVLYDLHQMFPSNINIDNTTIAFRVKSIVPKDTYLCDAFYFKAPLDIEEIPIKWILLSRYHNCEGELKIEIQPEFEYKAIHDDEKAGEEIIEDYITLNDNDTD